jgi:hypothetical protein
MVRPVLGGVSALRRDEGRRNGVVVATVAAVFRKWRRLTWVGVFINS